MVTQEEQIRYAQQLIMPSIGEAAKKKLKRSHILVAGLGGLGSLSAIYLTSLGIGHLKIIDHRSVLLSDLNRQIIYNNEDSGLKRAKVANEKLSLLNSDIFIEPVCEEITHENNLRLTQEVQVVIDRTDNSETGLFLKEARFDRGIPYIYGGIFGFKGKIATFIPGRIPCFECLYQKQEDLVQVVPVVGPMPGPIATLQALGALRLIIAFGNRLTGALLSFDGETMIFNYVDKKRGQDVRSVLHEEDGY